MQPDKRWRSHSHGVSRFPISKSRPKARKRYAIFAIVAMAALGWGGFLKFGLPLLLPLSPPANAEVADNLPPAAIPQILEPEYQTYELENATVRVVALPFGTPLSIAVADDLTTVEAFAQQEDALVVLNGGFFDPQNGKTTSHLVRQGQMVGDPAENERLVENPDLAPYMAQILNRSEFRVYNCQTDSPFVVTEYDIVLHDVAVPEGCDMQTAIGGGPQLLPEDTAYEEGFTDYRDGERVRDAIGSVGANARSAIAITDDNTILLVMVAQRPDASGFTLSEVAEFAASLGAAKLLNLDGGSSSAIYADGQMHFGRLDADGNVIERPVKSVIVVK